MSVVDLKNFYMVFVRYFVYVLFCKGSEVLLYNKNSFMYIFCFYVVYISFNGFYFNFCFFWKKYKYLDYDNMY